MLPLPMQDSLPAGWLAFTGRELNPLDHYERFPSCYISFPFPGFILTLHSSPPLDVVESYMWGREWVIATYKHPALPSWALEATWLITGAIGWPAYLLSQACVAATFLFVYLLGRELMGPSRAAAGTLLLTGVVFYAWPTTEFNHNVAEL